MLSRLIKIFQITLMNLLLVTRFFSTITYGYALHEDLMSSIFLIFMDKDYIPSMISFIILVMQVLLFNFDSSFQTIRQQKPTFVENCMQVASIPNAALVPV